MARLQRGWLASECRVDAHKTAQHFGTAAVAAAAAAAKAKAVATSDKATLTVLRQGKGSGHEQQGGVDGTTSDAGEGGEAAEAEAEAAAALLPLLSELCSRLLSTATQMAEAEADGRGVAAQHSPQVAGSCRLSSSSAAEEEGGTDAQVRVLVGGWNHLHAHALHGSRWKRSGRQPSIGGGVSPRCG